MRALRPRRDQAPAGDALPPLDGRGRRRQSGRARRPGAHGRLAARRRQRARPRSSTLTLVNLTVAVLVRNQSFLNALYGLAGRGSPSWPLWIRWSISKVHHVGGLHVGCAVAGTAWLGAFTGVAILTAVRYPGSVTGLTLALCLVLVGLLLVVTVVRHLTGPHARPQRVRADTPVVRVVGDRRVLGADRPPRRRRAGHHEPDSSPWRPTGTSGSLRS